MTLPTRKFGVEIEFIGIDRYVAAGALQSAGLRCEAENYNHRTSTGWKVVEDGSVVASTYGRGGELVSPPLSGEAGLTEVRTALRALVGAGATVNKTCGLHVHVDGAGLTGRDVASILVQYASHETLIEQFMPVSRRDNSYCQKIGTMYGFNSIVSTLSNGLGTGSILNVARRYQRYHTVNLASWTRHGTVEFRHHSGSVNAGKVTKWIQFVLYFVENARTSASIAAGPVVRRRGRQINYAARRALWTTLVSSVNDCRGYCDITQLSTVSGYSKGTVRLLLSGLNNRRQVGGSIVRIRTRYNRLLSATVYRQDALDAWLGNTAGVVSPVPVATVPARFLGTPDTLFAGMPADISGYYTERASEFGFDWTLPSAA